MNLKTSDQKPTQTGYQEPHRHTRRRKYSLIHFTKMHGLGNDFMVIETLTQQVILTTELIQAWSNRHTGVGFDQLLLISAPQSPDIDFQYQIFNADGSEVGQCGNGARAVARFILDQRLSVAPENVISTSTNTMTVRILESGLAQVDMDQPDFSPDTLPFLPADGQASATDCQQYNLKLQNKEIKFYPVSVGNPHAVIFLDNIDTIDTEMAKALQAHPAFPEGVNVGFAKVENENRLKLRVYERGAGETQACGSGAAAAAIAAIESGRLSGTDAEVELLGGVLRISWDKKRLQMTGPATRVYTGRMLVKQTDESFSV